MGFDPDDTVEKLIYMTVPLWGPFYAVLYLARLVFKELTNPDE